MDDLWEWGKQRGEKRKRKKSQQGQRELWEKWWFRSFSAHPAERRCDPMSLPPNRPVCSSAAGRLQFQARWPLCAELAKTTPSLIYDVYLYMSVYFFSFLPLTSDWYIHSAFFARLWIMEMDKCDLFLTPPPSPSRFFLYLFIYFILYESLWPGELRRFTAVFMCVFHVCVFLWSRTLWWNEACPSIETH